jgi:hypothetical protein
MLCYSPVIVGSFPPWFFPFCSDQKYMDGDPGLATLQATSFLLSIQFGSHLFTCASYLLVWTYDQTGNQSGKRVADR